MSLELGLAKYVGHLVTDFAHNQRKQKILQSLRDNETLVIHDFMMKFLPQKYAETQSEHFGKAGMSLHDSTFFLNFPVDYDFKAQGFKPLCLVTGCLHAERLCWVMPDDRLMVNCRMVLSDSKQDWQSTTSAIEESTRLFSEKYPHIDTISSQSDNAATYHGTGTITCQGEVIHKASGMTLIEQHFSVSGMGKDVQDTDFSHLKCGVFAYIRRGNDVITPKGLTRALNAGGGSKGSINKLIVTD